MSSDGSAPGFQPYDVELEQAVLGCFFTDNAQIDIAAGILDPADFYDPLHARLFDAILNIRENGEVNPITVHAMLKADPGLVEVGGMQYLAGLMQNAPFRAPMRQFSTILQDLSGRRSMVNLGHQLTELAMAPPLEEPTTELADHATEVLAKIANRSRPGSHGKPVSAGSALEALLKRIEAQAVAEMPHGVKTGLDPLDDVWGALYPGKLIILAGRPGMGKSILATNIAFAVSTQVPADYLSGEMGDDELAPRIGCDADFDRAIRERLTPLEYNDFTSLRASAGQLQRMAEANIRVRERPLEIIYQPGMTLEWIEGTCRRRCREKPGHRVVIIDHLQLVELRDARRGANRNEIQTEITKRLKALAGDLGITIIALSQLSRAVEGRDDKHPVLSDLREGGSIEQDADIVIGLLRPLRYARQAIQAAKNDEQRHKAIMEYDASKGVFEASFLKHRAGRETDYFQMFIDEKASAIRSHAPVIPDAGGELPLDYQKLAEAMRG